MNRFSFLVLLMFGWSVSPSGAEEHWPQFRGPQGNGISHARHLPLSWSETTNVLWKTPIHGKGWSSPVIWSNQVWLTTATPDGRELGVVCVDRATGKVVLDKKLYDVEKPIPSDPSQSYASPTPCIEEGRIYVSFGANGTACLDTSSGKLLWERRDLPANLSPAAASSPALFLDRLVLNFDGSDQQYVIALDKKNGQTIWQTRRSVSFSDSSPGGESRKAFSTPLVVLNGSQFTVVSAGSKALYAYDFTTGHELWRAEDPGSFGGYVRPIYGLGMIFYSTGAAKGELRAVRTGGSSVVTDTHVAWKINRFVPARPSPLLLGDLLYTVDDSGTVSCLEARTGSEVWHERVAGTYAASPLAGAGRIYLFSQEGKTTVLEAGRQFRILSQNLLGDGFMASPAVYGRGIYLRSKSALYRVEERLARP